MNRTNATVVHENAGETANRRATSSPECPTIAVSTKVQRYHQERRAIVYVRQSTPQQVRENKESTARQYALVQRARDLGWLESQIEVIDEDQAHSGRTSEKRLGFQRLLAEVSLDHVGLILGLEMSRIARSNKDWHHLLELCGIFDTLLADQDGVYDLTDNNDRLLMGLKGTISEAEIHILRGRLNEGRKNKAKRGELNSRLPMGYVKTPTGDVVLDPDEQVQTVVRLIFDKFEELGSASGVLKYMVRHGILLGLRQYCGPNRGELKWRAPYESYLVGMLHHPIYAGAYVHGRRATDPKRRAQGRAMRTHPSLRMEDWDVLIRDKLPAYISWDQYLAHQRLLEQNRARMASMGAVRDGLPLLSGLLFCGRCGYRLLPVFKDREVFRYVCCQRQLSRAEPRCQSLAGRVLDDLVTEKLLRVVQPAAAELSLAATEHLQEERDRLERHWRQRLERAGFEADRAFRQFNAVEPENRLVARELERRWENALTQVRQLEDEYREFSATQPTQLTEKDRQAIRSLSTAIPSLWQAETTSPADRKTILRQLVDRVVVSVQGDTEIVDVSIHWAGGFVSEHQIERPVVQYEDLRDFDQLKSRIEQLYDAGRTPAQIAEQLNREGFRPPNRRKTFSDRMVWRFLRENCRRGSRVYKLAELKQLGPHEWLLRDLAKELGLAEQTLHGWRRRGWIRGRQISGTQSHWIFRADDVELLRLRRLSQLTYLDRPYPKELTTPTPTSIDQDGRYSPQSKRAKTEAADAYPAACPRRAP